MENKNTVSVSICVLTYNRCLLLRELVEELRRLAYTPLEIIVIDNHSEDGTQEMMMSDFSMFRYIRTDSNIGAAARNIAMKEATGDICITLDDDVRGLEDKGVRTIVEKFSEDATLGAVNFSVRNSEGFICNWVHHCKQEDFYERDFLTYEITEGAVAFRKAALVRSGYYSEIFFLSHEGPDLAFRIIENGYKVTYTGSVQVTHLFASEGRESWRNYYYDTRNQLWLAARNFPVGYVFTYLARGLLPMFVYSVRDGYVTYWFKAIIDGIAGLKQVLIERRVLSYSTIDVIRRIDAQRPSLAYMIKKRLLGNHAVNLK